MSATICCTRARSRTGDTKRWSGEPDSAKVERPVREGGDGCPWRQGITLPTSLYRWAPDGLCLGWGAVVESHYSRGLLADHPRRGDRADRGHLGGADGALYGLSP